MSLRLSKFRCPFALALLGLSALAGWGQTPGQGPPVSPASISAAGGSTNAVGPVRGRDGLKRLEDELSKALQGLMPKGGALDGVLPPAYHAPIAPPAANKRKRTTDAEKDWGSLTPEKPESSLTPDDPFRLLEPGTGNEGQKKGVSSKDPSDELWNRWRNDGLGRGSMTEDNGRRSRGQTETKEVGRSNGSRDEDKTPAEIKRAEEKLKNQLNAQNQSGTFAPPTRSSLSDFFGLGDHTLTPEQESAHKAYLQEYKRLLEGPAPGSSSALNPFGAAPAASAMPGYGGLSTYSKPSGWTAFDTPSGAINPSFTPSLPPDASLKVLNQWNPAYIPPPKVEPPRFSTTPPPFADLPRRKF